MTWEIRQGHVLNRLRELPAESVHCVVTSPPYLALRAYGTEPQVWGGDENCQHEWGALTIRNADVRNTLTWNIANEPSTSGSCPCGAWRGELGSEPTVEQFVAHLVEVFREVRRVLRRDGTLWLNIGDSMYGSGRGPTGHNGIGDQTKRQGFSSSDYGRAYGKNGRGQPGYQDGDCPWSSPCDECLTAFDRRTTHSDSRRAPESVACEAVPSRGHSLSPDSSPGNSDSTRQKPSKPGDHATLDQPLGPVRADVQPLEAPASTTVESSRPPLAGCSRCSMCGACRSAIHSSSGDARECVHTSGEPSRMSERAPGTASFSSRLEHHSHCTSTVCLAQPQPPDSQAQYTSKLKPKDLMLVPERLAIALQADGWWVRSRIAWCKTSAMPESVSDRPTSAWEHIWMVSKSRSYYYDAEAVRVSSATSTAERAHLGKRPISERQADMQRLGMHGESDTLRVYDRDGANLRNFWLLGPSPFAEAHFATFPPEIPRRAILAGTSAKGVCPECGAPWRRVVERIRVGSYHDHGNDGVQYGLRQNGKGPAASKTPPVTLDWQPSCRCDAGEPIPATVLDPFAGAGTTLLVADRLGRNAIGVELNPAYVEMSRKRLVSDAPLFMGELAAYAPPEPPEPDKQARVGKRTYSGFNARWDAKEQQTELLAAIESAQVSA